MEFKVFKNENSKILKEYWLTQSEWDALDKTTVQDGDIYHIVGTIDKGDLSADVNASLAKGDSSLQKPTTTLAKESFVKFSGEGIGGNFGRFSVVGQQGLLPEVDGLQLRFVPFRCDYTLCVCAREISSVLLLPGK